MSSYRRRSPRRGGEQGSFWLSFSDMMSVLVLIFIFVIFGMLFSLDETKTGLEELRGEYAAAMTELDASKTEQQQLIILLSEKESELEETKTELSAAEESLNATTAIITDLKSAYQSVNQEKEALSSELDSLSQKYVVLAQDKTVLENSVNSLESRINSLKDQLSQKQSEYDALASSAEGSKALIATYESELNTYKQQLAKTQADLEQMLGVKARIIESLSSELSRRNISVEVDKQTGAILLSGGALFDSGSVNLKSGGMNYLDNVLPVYFSVLMSSEFRPYIADIVIEGHTDSSAPAGHDAYLYNMQLSQDRAYAVANYVLNRDYMLYTLKLSSDKAQDLRTLVSASGRSFSALIKNADGSENKEASRRVEIKFRLIDDETIETTRYLLGLLDN